MFAVTFSSEIAASERTANCKLAWPLRARGVNSDVLRLTPAASSGKTLISESTGQIVVFAAAKAEDKTNTRIAGSLSIASGFYQVMCGSRGRVEKTCARQLCFKQHGMIMPMRFFLWFAATMLACTRLACAADLRAGIGKVDITPPPGE